MMIKLSLLTAVCSVSALMAVPAGAAGVRVSSPTDAMVRILVAGKSSAQLDMEIRAAAESVCSTQHIYQSSCVADSIADAEAQLSLIQAANHTSATTNVEITHDGPSTIHVSLKNKSAAQIDSDIRAAAQTVCKNVGYAESEYAACVEAAISDAKFQLNAIVAQSDKPSQLASN